MESTDTLHHSSALTDTKRQPETHNAHATEDSLSGFVTDLNPESAERVTEMCTKLSVIIILIIPDIPDMPAAGLGLQKASE